jgi:hypothetical protein
MNCTFSFPGWAIYLSLVNLWFSRNPRMSQKETRQVLRFTLLEKKNISHPFFFLSVFFQRILCLQYFQPKTVRTPDTFSFTTECPRCWQSVALTVSLSLWLWVWLCSNLSDYVTAMTVTCFLCLTVSKAQLLSLYSYLVSIWLFGPHSFTDKCRLHCGCTHSH